jgi:phosphoglycerate dehydrogenase-like enzyme
VSARPLRILASERAARAFEPEIARVMDGRPFAMVTAEAAQGDVDVALITRDVTGLSTKHQVLESTQRYYDAMRRSPNLKWVHMHSAGADRPIYLELRGRGVALTSSSGVNASGVAQMALAGILALTRRMHRMMAAQREHRWAPLVGMGELPPDISEQTVVIVGWGPIAQLIGTVLRTLGARLIVVRHGREPAAGALETVAYEDIHSVLSRADWLVLACPLSDRTRALIDARAFAAMPRGAHLANVARGEVVVQADLIAALRAGGLGGAYLDVFEHEPLPADSPLWDLENVIVTPHSAGQSGGNYRRVGELFVENLGAWLASRPLRNAVA